MRVTKKYGPTDYRPTIRDQVEQAIARGDAIDQICRNLDVTPGTVVRARQQMDAAIAESAPKVAPNRYRRTVAVHPCGTRAAYERHLSRFEPIDEACRDARRERDRQVRQRRSAA